MKIKINTITLCWIILVAFAFVSGLWSGTVLHQEHINKGMFMIAKGLEGTTFNVEVDFNETLLVEATYKNLEKYGIFNLTNETILEGQVNK